MNLWCKDRFCLLFGIFSVPMEKKIEKGLDEEGSME